MRPQRNGFTTFTTMLPVGGFVHQQPFGSIRRGDSSLWATGDGEQFPG
jgi:hypothetical protein